MMLGVIASYGRCGHRPLRPQRVLWLFFKLAYALARMQQTYGSVGAIINANQGLKMEGEQEQGGSEPSKVAVGDAHIAPRHVVGGDAHIAPPALGSSIGEIT